MIEGGAGHEGKKIMVFYHKPGNHTPDSPILIVVPGAGRNGDDYRDLISSFENNLTLLLGELDNADETGGTLLRSVSADRQGLHRLARGKYFFRKSKQIAADLRAPFNWKLEIVPGVGHQFREMGAAAADKYPDRFNLS